MSKPGSDGSNWDRLTVLTLDPTFFAVSMPAVIFAGITRGGFGFGVAFAPTAILALILEPAAAPVAFRPLIGTIGLAIILWRVSHRTGLARAASLRLPSRVGMLSGTVTGIASFVSHAGGPVAACILSQRLVRTTDQATTVLVPRMINIARFVPYAYLDMFTST